MCQAAVQYKFIWTNGATPWDLKPLQYLDVDFLDERFNSISPRVLAIVRFGKEFRNGRVLTNDGEVEVTIPPNCKILRLGLSNTDIVSDVEL